MNVDRCSNLLGLDFIDPLVYVTDLFDLENYFYFFLPDEREAVQKKTFTKWVNSHLGRMTCRIGDLYTDLRDGRMLIRLLEVLSGEQLVSNPSIYRSFFISIYVSIHPSLHPSIPLCIHLYIHSCMHPYIHPCIHSMHPSIHASISNKPSINQMLGCCDNHYNIIYYICFTSRSLV